MIGHISSGLVALVLGPFQFWKAFRNKYLTVHRWSGRIYLTAILIGTIFSTSLAWINAIEVNFAWDFSLQGLTFTWITTVSIAYFSVTREHIQQGKEWINSGYVVTFDFVIFRWLNELTIVKNLMPEFD